MTRGAPLVAALLALAAAPSAHATLPGSNGNIAVVGGNFGSHGLLITKTPGRHDAKRRRFPLGAMAASPDGRHVAIDNRNGLYLYDVGSGRGRLLTRKKHMNAAKQLGSVSFSSDGRRVLFEGPVGDESRGGRFYVVGVDGRGLHRVGGRGAHGYTPMWSPDGRTIAFLRPNGRHVISSWGDLYVMSSAGGRAHRIFHPAVTSGVVSSFGWAPGGKRLVVTTESDDAFPPASAQLGTLVINRRGRFLRRIATDAQDPVWSPDGRHIAFHTGDGLHTPILTMDPRGNHRHRVFDFPSTIVRAIAWLPTS
jgi:Tol biopolymer transport system component